MFQRRLCLRIRSSVALRYVSRHRQPVEVSDDEAAPGNQEPQGLGCRSGAVEPVPALARGDHVEGVGAEARFLGEPKDVLDAGACLGIQALGLG